MSNYLDKLYSLISESENYKIYGPKNLPDNVFPDPKVMYCKAALEAKFNKKFTEKEVRTLIKEEYSDIPQWYKDKWLKKTDR